MVKRIVFRDTESSTAAELYAEKALQKIEKFLEKEREPIYIDVIIQPGIPHAHHRCEILLKSPNYDLVTHDEGPHIYQVLDNAIDLMYQQLRKKKEERVNDKRTADSYKGA